VRQYTAHHSLAPPIAPNAFFYISTFTIIAVKWDGEINKKLLTIIHRLFPDTIKNFQRNAIGIGIAFKHDWWYRTYKHSFCNPVFAIFVYITNYLATTGGMPDVDGIS
jgi:hypothetical protein